MNTYLQRDTMQKTATHVLNVLLILSIDDSCNTVLCMPLHSEHCQINSIHDTEQAVLI